MPATIYIKGNRMRSDVHAGTRTRTTILDLDARTMYTFDSMRKEAESWDIAVLGRELSSRSGEAHVTSSMTPNGQTRPLHGHSAVGYDVEIHVSTTIGSVPAAELTIKFAGPVWIVKDAPGVDEYVGFYRSAAEQGWVLNDPRAATSDGPGAAAARAMTELYRLIAESHGMAYESDMTLTMTGTGPVTEVLSTIGDVSMLTVVDAVTTTEVREELFVPPPGYVVTRK